MGILFFPNESALKSLQAAEKTSRYVILSGAKDLLFVCFQGETADASLRSA
jgi:hypothetical protein